MFKRDVLRTLREYLRAKGLDGVLAEDFRAPESMDMRRKSLRILRDCRRAIFEMSYRGAQNVEYDRLLDYELVQPLVVVEQGAEQLNSFEREIATRMGAKVGMYSDESELLRLVDAWLGSDGAAPAWPVYERVRSEPSY